MTQARRPGTLGGRREFPRTRRDCRHRQVPGIDAGPGMAAMRPAAGATMVWIAATPSGAGRAAGSEYPPATQRDEGFQCLPPIAARVECTMKGDAQVVGGGHQGLAPGLAHATVGIECAKHHAVTTPGRAGCNVGLHRAKPGGVVHEIPGARAARHVTRDVQPLPPAGNRGMRRGEPTRFHGGTRLDAPGPNHLHRNGGSDGVGGDFHHARLRARRFQTRSPAPWRGASR